MHDLIEKQSFPWNAWENDKVLSEGRVYIDLAHVTLISRRCRSKMFEFLIKLSPDQEPYWTKDYSLLNGTLRHLVMHYNACFPIVKKTTQTLPVFAEYAMFYVETRCPGFKKILPVAFDYYIPPVDEKKQDKSSDPGEWKSLDSRQLYPQRTI